MTKSRARTELAKVFWSGRSQAVRLPKRFRFDCREVRVRKEGESLVLEPTSVELDAKGWPKGFWKVFGRVDESFDVGERRQPAERAHPLR